MVMQLDHSNVNSVVSNSPSLRTKSRFGHSLWSWESVLLAISNFSFFGSPGSLKKRGSTVYDNEFEIKEHTEL